MIYRVDHNMDHLERFEDFEAEWVKPGSSAGMDYYLPDFDYRKFNPEVLEFRGDLGRLKLTDFPHTRPSLPLMSYKMLLACLSAGEFVHDLHPVRILDQTRDETEVDQEEIEQQVPTADKKFVVVHLRAYTDVIDLDQTILARRDRTTHKNIRRYLPYSAREYTEDDWLPVEEIERLCLTVDEAQLPGLIRFPNLYGLYCATKTREACEHAGVVGVKFTPLPIGLGTGVRELAHGGYRLVAEEELARL